MSSLKVGTFNKPLVFPLRFFLDGSGSYIETSRWQEVIRINGLYPTYKWGMNWGYNPLILTFDPNFLGYPSIYKSPLMILGPAGYPP